MKNLNLQLIILLLQLSYTIVNSQVPSSGCEAISSEGNCFRHYTGTSVNWAEAKLACETGGYDLATVGSDNENTLLYSTVTYGTACWIGFNDIDEEGTFVWADGSNSTYTNWHVLNPDNYQGNQDCTKFWGTTFWDDDSCTRNFACYFCSLKVNVFGQIIVSTYTSLTDNTALTSDTTLYCVTENRNTPQVKWSYLDGDGIRTDLISTTDATTGASTIPVYTTQPGYYSCEITQNGGDIIIYTAVVTEPYLGSEITSLSVEYTSENSIFISWDLLGPVLTYGNLITFSISLTTSNYVLVATTKDLEIELNHFTLSNTNYTILVELQVPFTTHTISATTSVSTSGIPTFQSNEVLQNTNQLTQYTQYSSYITMIGIMFLILLMVLSLVIQFINCCIMKRRSTKEDIQRDSALTDTGNLKHRTYDVVNENVRMQTVKKSTKEAFVNNPNYEHRM